MGYDLKGNKTYHENSNGYGYLYLFDENNNLISEIDIQYWKKIQHRNSIINNLL